MGETGAVGAKKQRPPQAAVELSESFVRVHAQLRCDCRSRQGSGDRLGAVASTSHRRGEDGTHVSAVRLGDVRRRSLGLRLADFGERHVNVTAIEGLVAHLDGKHVFQCFWSDPQTRVFECFGVSFCILDGENVFSCFWSDPKTRVFECFSEVLYCFCHLGLPACRCFRGSSPVFLL